MYNNVFDIGDCYEPIAFLCSPVFCHCTRSYRYHVFRLPLKVYTKKFAISNWAENQMRPWALGRK